MPSQEHDTSSVGSLRLPDALLERLDRYLDWRVVHRGEPSSRHHAMRHALMQGLEAQEEQGGRTHPDVLRRHFPTAYTSLRSGRDEVAMHHIRRLRGWPDARFEAMVEQLRAASHVGLHVGNASDLSDEGQRHSYEVNGQVSLYFCWQQCIAIQVDLNSLVLVLRAAVDTDFIGRTAKQRYEDLELKK